MRGRWRDLRKGERESRGSVNAVFGKRSIVGVSSNKPGSQCMYLNKVFDGFCDSLADRGTAAKLEGKVEVRAPRICAAFEPVLPRIFRGSIHQRIIVIALPKIQQ